MTSKISVTVLLLFVILAVGFAYAIQVSYRNYTGDLCPNAGPVPICYIVLLAYALMLVSLSVRNHGIKHYTFTVGWGVAFVFALLGSVAEFFTPGGGICPSSNGGGLRGSSDEGIPMCYVSLALVIVVLLLFLQGPYRKTCNEHNSR